MHDHVTSLPYHIGQGLGFFISAMTLIKIYLANKETAQ